MCLSKAKSKKVPEQQHSLQMDEVNAAVSDSELDFPEYGIHYAAALVRHSDQILATVNRSKLQMEINTGTPGSIVGEDTFKQLWPEDQRPSLSPAKVKLRTCR